MLNKLRQNYVVSDFIIIFLLAVVIRLLFVFAVFPLIVDDPHSVLDPDNFGVRAINVLEGRGFSDDDNTPTVYREPLYSFFMAGIWILSDQGRVSIQVANAILGGLTAGLTFLLAYYSFGRAVGWGAALLYGFFPINIWFVPLYRFEALFTPFLALCGILYIRLRKYLHWGDAIALGIVLGLATLNSQVVLLFPSVLIVTSLFESSRWKSLLTRIGVAMLVMTIIILPWTLRNYNVTNGGFYIVRQGGPLNFLFGNFQASHYDEAPMQLSALRNLASDHYTTIVLNATGATSYDEITVAEQERVLGREVVNFVTKHPDQFLWKVIVLSTRFWYLADTKAKSWFMLSMNLPLLLLAFWGMVQAIRCHKKIWFYVFAIAYFNLIYAAIWVEARYTVPIEPYVMTLASYGLLSVTPVRKFMGHLKLVLQSHNGFRSLTKVK
jgi:4-amino-4-deoxy-L-arabinose transferase-like glycosyltransferase